MTPIVRRFEERVIRPALQRVQRHPGSDPASPSAPEDVALAAGFDGSGAVFEREHNASAETRWHINDRRLPNARPRAPEFPPFLTPEVRNRRRVPIDRTLEWKPKPGGDPIRVLCNGVFNPAFAHDPRTGESHLFARARDDRNVSRIVHLVSERGAPYRLDPQSPVVMAPELLSGTLAEWAKGGGCEDARISRLRDQDGSPLWLMSFTVYNEAKNVASIALATAKSLRGPWTARQLAFPQEAERGRWTKSFTVVQLPDGGYVGFGSRDISIPDSPDAEQGTRGDGSLFMATSKNGLDWTVVQDPLASTRAGEFDGRLVECAFALPVGRARYCLFVNGDGPPAGYQLGFQLYRLPRSWEKLWARLRGHALPPLVLERRSRGPFFSHDPSAPWELNGPIEKVIFTAGGGIVEAEDGSGPVLRLGYGCNDMECATADVYLAPWAQALRS